MMGPTIPQKRSLGCRRVPGKRESGTNYGASLTAGGDLAHYVQPGLGERNAQAEGGALAVEGFEVHRAVMPLQNLVGLCEADATPVFLCGEVELEDLVLDFFRNAATCVADLGENHALITPGADGKLAALSHHLYAVDHDVQNGLLHEVGVHLYVKGLIRKVPDQGHAMLFGIGGGQQGHVFQQAAHVHLLELKIARAGEVDQDLHDPIEPVNFASDDVHVPASTGVDLLQLVLQKVQVQDDGVNGILHLVRHTSSEPAAGREAA